MRLGGRSVLGKNGRSANSSGHHARIGITYEDNRNRNGVRKEKNRDDRGERIEKEGRKKEKKRKERKDERKEEQADGRIRKRKLDDESDVHRSEPVHCEIEIRAYTETRVSSSR